MDEIRAKEMRANEDAADLEAAYNFILEAIKSRSSLFITEIIRDDKKSEVFKVTLDGKIFAVKRLKGNFAKKLVDFDNEISCVGGVLGHTNIMKLIGCFCDDKEECIIVYDFPWSSSVTVNTLQDGIKTGLRGELRMKFASDIAYALLFIHEAVPPIIHGNLQPRSILYNNIHGDLQPSIFYNN
ncbi:hypothetical protein CASFOL_023837 [Castilleja foliolosa]|uniref:Protein kinase domain-containing protein n=1 Tax=Castilleja foliolosa TaxID=1961234 RepID=A0ABD3CLM6_9LAMI